MTATKGSFFVVVRNDVLPQFRADFFEPIAQVTNYGKRPQNGMFSLRHVVNREEKQVTDNDKKCDEPPGHAKHYLFARPYVGSVGLMCGDSTGHSAWVGGPRQNLTIYVDEMGVAMATVGGGYVVSDGL